MRMVYLYMPDTMADWETGYVTAELYSGRFFRKDAPEVRIRTVSADGAPIRTMGGLSVMPELAAGDVTVDADSVLILPGADTWSDARHQAVLETAAALLSAGGTVCAICGATVALASSGLMAGRRHTSNGTGFLDMMVPGYEGHELYADAPAIADGGLITAGTTSGLAWARLILEELGVFRPETLEAWYGFFSTGDQAAFFRMMGSLQE